MESHRDGMESRMHRRPRRGNVSCLLPQFIKVIIVFCCICPTNILAIWWAVGGQLVLDRKTICRKSRGIGGRQRDICLHEPEVVDEVSHGVRMAVDECGFQLQDRRWNCSTDRRSMKKLLDRLPGTKEAAFLGAITSAGVFHRLFDSCSRGRLIDCSCGGLGYTSLGRGGRAGRGTRTVGSHGRTGRDGLRGEGSEGREEKWLWKGCDDYVAFAYMKSKQFIDVDRRKFGSDFVISVRLHNSEAGRLASARHLRRVCKCHGLSGSCTTTSCWRKLPPFVQVADRLRDAYDTATLVQLPNRGGSEVIGADPWLLVNTQPSPNYCERVRDEGSLGTVGRTCDFRSVGLGGCDVMCCGRGFVTYPVTVVENCKCKFRWCCEVVCQTCERQTTMSTCR